MGNNELVPEPKPPSNWHESASRSHNVSTNDHLYSNPFPWFGAAKSTEAQDHEASAALLMLNASDRRSRVEPKPPPGQSVKSRLGFVEQTAAASTRAISVKDLLGTY